MMIISGSKKNRILKYVLSVILALSVSAIGYCYYDKYYADGIKPYDAKRDRAAVIKIFNDEWDWLLPDREYSVENMLDLKRASYDHSYDGKLQMYVYRDGRKTVGFTAFYKIKFYHGQILFLAIDKDYRRKGYARKLFKYDVDSLISQGCFRLLVITRPWNDKAKALYVSEGFEETAESDDKFIRLEKNIRKKS